MNSPAAPTRIQVRFGTTALWASSDPILATGEPGFDSNLGQLRIGDGVTRWSRLIPINQRPPGILPPMSVPHDGANVFTLPFGIVAVTGLYVQESTGGVRMLFEDNYEVVTSGTRPGFEDMPPQLAIRAQASLKTGDELRGLGHFIMSRIEAPPRRNDEEFPTGDGDTTIS